MGGASTLPFSTADVSGRSGKPGGIGALDVARQAWAGEWIRLPFIFQEAA